MAIIEEISLEGRLAHRLRDERQSRNWTIAELAQRSGVSKAMISKVERGESSPTAALLGRLSGAFGVTLSNLIAGIEPGGARYAPKAKQMVWLDPETGFERRALTPNQASATEIIHGTLPPGKRIAYPAASYAFIAQQIVGQSGTLTFIEGAKEFVIREGDCLVLGAPMDCAFENRARRPCSYLVVVSRRG